MSEVWKFELRAWTIFHDLPKGAEVLSAGAQGDAIVAWAVCDPEAPKVSRLLTAVPTGRTLPPAFEAHRARFVDTVQMDDGLVFHIYEGKEADRA